MPDSTSKRTLPPHPSLEQHKKQARELLRDFRAGNSESMRRVSANLPRLVNSSPGGSGYARLTLADAQLIVAREHGFLSWPMFKREVEDRAASFQRSVNELLVAAVPGPSEYHMAGESTDAEQRLRDEPALASGSIYAASIAGNAEMVRRMLKERPELASTAGGPNNWVPLLYACFSRLLRFHPEDSDSFVATATVLLAHGADVNCTFDSNGERESALYGAAGVAKNEPLTRLLLECGADPNDDEATYHAAEEPGVACLNAMVEFGHDLNATGTALLRKLDFDDVGGVARLLHLGTDPNAGMRRWGKTALHQAIMRERNLDTIRLLMAAGADLNATSQAGNTPYALAMELGRNDVKAELIAAGAQVA